MLRQAQPIFISQMNAHFMKKLPVGVETSNILVGELSSLDKPLSCFVRLQDAAMLGDLTEVPVPTRFIFILLGPGVNITCNNFDKISDSSIPNVCSDNLYRPYNLIRSF